MVVLVILLCVVVVCVAVFSFVPCLFCFDVCVCVVFTVITVSHLSCVGVCTTIDHACCAKNSARLKLKVNNCPRQPESMCIAEISIRLSFRDDKAVVHVRRQTPPHALQY